MHLVPKLKCLFVDDHANAHVLDSASTNVLRIETSARIQQLQPSLSLIRMATKSTYYMRAECNFQKAHGFEN